MSQLIVSTALTTTLSLLLFFLIKKRKLKKKSKNLSLCIEQDNLNNKLNEDQMSQLASKMDDVMKKEKIFTNPTLSIHDLASQVGTNRSYISTTINSFYNQNFCAYVNQYRFGELADTIKKENDYTHKELATKCGFGSIDSMKRVVKQKTGLSMKEWKSIFIEGSMKDS